jgi:hypothetical protein
MIETMADTFDGLAIARQRIAEEAEARTGFLDLSGLGLTVLPQALFRLGICASSTSEPASSGMALSRA